MKKFNKTILITVIFICLVQCITVESSGKNSENTYKIFNITNCYGPATVKIKCEHTFMEGEYNIVKFEKTGNDRKYKIWTYNCYKNESLPIVIRTLPDVSNVCDIRLEYYIGPYIETGKIDSEGLNDAQMNNDNNRRRQVFTNVMFSFQPKKRTEFKFPSILNSQSDWIFITIGLIFFVVFGSVFYVFYRVFFKERPSKITNSSNIEEPTDDEVWRMIEKHK